MTAIASHISRSPLSLAGLTVGAAPMASRNAAAPMAARSPVAPMGQPSEIAMRQSAGNSRQFTGIGRQVAVAARQLSDGERVCDFLRSLYPDRTAANVAADTRGRISARTVENWLVRASAPSFSHTFTLIRTYGPAFMCACMDDAPDWLDEAARRAEQARLEAQYAELKSRIEAAR